ncbi:Aquaporin Z [Ralstonia mannitolilytica]|uniref:aquaporin n=1 Tax=Ralstonia mannitolilytica TaxID=105219 RepID=UPI0028F63B01|nr:aquaporin [Ralstonia mannitolilytica]CAJ0782279.1 Aquaporin Z [Ralstonia mannitolilytica]
MATVSPLRAAASATSPAPSAVSLARRLVAEALGTALLIAVVIGTGIHANRLSGGDATWTLLAQSLAGGAGLLALLTVFAPVSGAHLNPAVTLSAALQGGLRAREALAYVAAQTVGAALGVAAVHAMYGMAVWSAGTHAATGGALWWSEALATFGLIGAGIACGRHAPRHLPAVVAAYIAAGYWFTSSSSLANPALAFACALTDGPSGIRPEDVPGYMLAQLAGALLATPLFRWLAGAEPARARHPVAVRTNALPMRRQATGRSA